MTIFIFGLTLVIKPLVNLLSDYLSVFLLLWLQQFYIFRVLNFLLILSDTVTEFILLISKMSKLYHEFTKKNTRKRKYLRTKASWSNTDEAPSGDLKGNIRNVI